MVPNISIRARHVSITSAIKGYVEKKLSKLEKFFDHIQDISVDLDVNEVSDQNQRQVAAAIIKVPGSTITAKESSKDMYASVDILIDKLGKQLIKYKDKLKHKDRERIKESKIITEAPLKKKDPPRVVTQKNKKLYIPKPMHPEDAVDIMDLEKASFLVFRNAATENINVIYRMEDGNYGLIET